MSQRLVNGILVAFAVLLAAVAALSLAWPLYVDSPILLYAGWLMEEEGRLPYRDLFEMNMPATHIFHFLVAALLGTGDLAFRIADLSWLAAILAVTWWIQRPLGRPVAAAGAVLFGLAYLAHGPYFSLQREILLLLPAAGALLVLVRSGRSGPRTRTLIASLLVGVAAAIKPHAAILLPLILFFQARGGKEEGSRLKGIARHLPAAVAGSLIAPVLTLLYLAATGSLGEFVEIARSYWPLYSRLSVSHQVIEGADRLIYLIRGFSRFGSLGLWLAPAAIGFSIAIFHSRLGTAERRQVAMTGGFAACFAIYPLLSGQFWDYHYLPLLYFLVLLASTCLVNPAPGSPRGLRGLALGLLLLAALLKAHPPLATLAQVTGGSAGDDRIARVEAMAGFLEERLQPGDRVQPLDWTGGAVHAMLRSRASLATRFLYDFHFYHHLSDPYIAGLRGRFLSEFDAAGPRFVIEITDEKPWPWGEGTSREFPDLRRRLLSRYRAAARGEGWVIHERAEQIPR